jgi:hypothetical protein
MKSFLNDFPGIEQLVEWHDERAGKTRKAIAGSNGIPAVNGHIHSPYSFSAFRDLEQAFRMASQEGMKVLGINDFNTTAGYSLFHDLGVKSKVFPLFNIEFMGLMPAEQERGVRINDPSNPGRIYFSGKGLDYPVTMGEADTEMLGRLREEGHRQVREMVSRLNRHLQSAGSDLRLDFELVKKEYTRGMVRERHIARALRIIISDRYDSVPARTAFLKTLYGGTAPSAPQGDEAAVENEIRSRLLKAGGAAFVEEDPDAFPGLEDIISVIRGGGGIPCYPVLLDDNKGWLTEFEADPEALFRNLTSRNISCIELIPGRNDIDRLRDFVTFFHERGFVITFGTEHNTPSLEPLTVSARNGISLDEMLQGINFEGACVIAAHQYLRAKGEAGYPGFAGKGRQPVAGPEAAKTASGNPATGTWKDLPAETLSLVEIRKEFALLGRKVIEYFNDGAEPNAWPGKSTQNG